LAPGGKGETARRSAQVSLGSSQVAPGDNVAGIYDLRVLFLSIDAILGSGDVVP